MLRYLYEATKSVRSIYIFFSLFPNFVIKLSQNLLEQPMPPRDPANDSDPTCMDVDEDYLSDVSMEEKIDDDFSSKDPDCSQLEDVVGDSDDDVHDNDDKSKQTRNFIQ